jgi:osmotically-inducible protein OsmY
MKFTLHLIPIAALSLLPLISACQTMKSESITVKTPTVETPQDEALSKSVRDRLLAAKKVDLANVKIVSSGGTVYLSGTVKSLDARQQAIKLAWEVRGVQSVVNSLEVEK